MMIDEKSKAEILCELENGKTEKYEIEIQRVYTANNEDNKSMLIKITDKRLIEKTGGIIQRNEWRKRRSMPVQRTYGKVSRNFFVFKKC